MNCNQLFRIVIWVTKLLVLIECQCTISIVDPEWNKQWYLQKNRMYRYDMNVMPAWRSCVDGTGVTVGVVDKGVEDHSDLNINRYLDTSRRQRWEDQYNARTRQPSREGFGYYRNSQTSRYQEILKHGTRVAGIVAAKKNQMGIIGIAFGAQIADVQIASSSVFENFNASLLRHRDDVIDIYSCSFANFHTGTKTYPLLHEQKSALESGTTQGRNGLGSVYVFATGNSGGDDRDVFRDSCAYDRLVTNRYVISVAGIQHDLQKLPNGEACSAMMVTAFTAKAGAQNIGKVITTDIGNTTTDHFNQNSAAAPMVSGAVALALSANSALTYRDIMHLLVKTSRSNLTNQYRTNFFRNAAGIYVSSYFGFGLIDIGMLVERSKTWRNVPPIQYCRAEKTFDSPLNSDSTYFMVQVTGCSATYIEHVEISLKVDHQHAGQIQWVLVSPYGTKSKILPGRGLDPTTNMDITVLTVQLWGENPNGLWKFEPTAVFGKTLDHGTVESVGLSIHGYTCQGQHCLPPAEQGVGSWGNWLSWSECTGTCGQGIKSRSRQCNVKSNSAYCAGDSSQTELCPLSNCQPDIQSEITSSGCPSPASLPTRCVEQCSSNRNCRGQRKCCYNGCGHTCETSRTRITFSGCPSPASLPTRCVEQCSSDWDCRGQGKCCYNGCGHTCETSRSHHTTPTPTARTVQGMEYWREWSEWSTCSVTCGYGTSSRTCTRTTFRCRVGSRQIKDCYNGECPHQTIQEPREQSRPDCSDSFDNCRSFTRLEVCYTLEYANTHCRKRCGLC
ncbi:furin-like protease kpc-1 isoform X2 [Mytilus californianus]|uniref:furin-like protease kpc-1 isoform X2 n=1 Tax=Mytilus californianus TaxID=6549 RepID=UPI00224662E1|nr:furin-like protease kpc-1 isoform X2 [Mytilus californianus]